MQKEMMYYRKSGVRGVSVYSEPGDWFTYGVSHYVFAGLAWNPDTVVEPLMRDYADVVYENAGPVVVDIYRELEDIVRFASNIAHTSLKEQKVYDGYAGRVAKCRDRVATVILDKQTDDLTRRNLERLDLMLEYAAKSITFMQTKSSGNEEYTRRLDVEIRSFLKQHATEGIFIPHRN